MANTSAAQARIGKDIKGIPWEMFKISRERYILTRLEKYRNFENTLTSGDVVGKVFFLFLFPLRPLFGVVVEHEKRITICFTNVLMYKSLLFSPYWGPKSSSK